MPAQYTTEELKKKVAKAWGMPWWAVFIEWTRDGRVRATTSSHSLLGYFDEDGEFAKKTDRVSR